jgi:predicted nucleotidyltransferase component of viral defense system
MLHTATVDPATLAILIKLMKMPECRQFNLVGGTALALQIGHRISIDLDLFTHEDYDSEKLIPTLQSLGNMDILVDKPPFLQLMLDGLKVDFLKFPYDFVQAFVEIEGIRLVPIENIGVMKFMAIARRGSKKDFYDLYFLLERYSLHEMIRHFEAKLPQVDLFHIVKSLTYFEDAEPDADPNMLIEVSWPTVKKEIAQKVKSYL